VGVEEGAVVRCAQGGAPSAKGGRRGKRDRLGVKGQRI